MIQVIYSYSFMQVYEVHTMGIYFIFCTVFLGSFGDAALPGFV